MRKRPLKEQFRLSYPLGIYFWCGGMHGIDNGISSPFFEKGLFYQGFYLLRELWSSLLSLPSSYSCSSNSFSLEAIGQGPPFLPTLSKK